MRLISNEMLDDIVGEFDVEQWGYNIYVEFKDGTPSFRFSTHRLLNNGVSHLMVDNILADQMLKHWEDHNIPPIPKEALCHH